MGKDNYYNNSEYLGWHHKGYGIGNPLVTSIIYNEDHSIHFKNNRISAWHIGVSGDITSEFQYRLLLTHTNNWGTYAVPFNEKKNQFYSLLEISYTPQHLTSLELALATAYDNGNLLGNNTGVMVTAKWSGVFKKIR